MVPPALLYHGTVARHLPGIRAEGLLPRGRTHVHLSVDRETAVTVGVRRGDPVVLTVDAAGMLWHAFDGDTTSAWPPHCSTQYLISSIPATRAAEIAICLAGHIRAMGFSAEAYIFVAMIYFVCCFYMSNFSRKLERELDTGL